MSLIERISPLSSPSSRCYQKFYPIIATSLSVTLLESANESGDSIGDNDLNKERNYYRSNRKSMSSSTTSSPKLKYDEFLLKYIKSSTGNDNNNTAALTSSFPTVSKFKKESFYGAYIRDIDSNINIEPGRVDIIQSEKNSVILPTLLNHGKKSLDGIVKSSIKDSISGEKTISSPSYFGEKSPKVHIKLPSASSKSSFQKIKYSTKEESLKKIYKLPKDFANCSIDDLITLISRMLKSLILLNDNNMPKATSKSDSDESGTTKSSLTRYHSRTPPSISIPTYLARLTKFNNFTNATLLTTIYYIDLLSHHYQPYFTLNSWTVHRFLLVGTMLSQKLMEDFFFTNDHYAKVGGVAISELNCLELDFLTRVDWKCIPTKQMENGKTSIKYAKEVLDIYYKQLVQLMGHNVTKEDDTYFEANADEVEYGKQFVESSHGSNQPDKQETKLEQDITSDYDDYDEDDEVYDSDEIMEYADVPQRFSPSIVKSSRGANSASLVSNKFDSFGYSIDGSSSPHLKRRYSIQSED